VILKKLENSHAFLAAILVGGLTLLVLVVSDLGGKLPNRTELKSRSNSTDVAMLVHKMEATISPATLAASHLTTNGVSPFYTTHFQPPAPPTKTPGPVAAKPSPKKIQLVFQGVYQTAAGEKKAFVKVGDAVVVGTVGTKVVSDWTISEITLRTLTLKNAVAQTNILEFKVAKEIEDSKP
jgi:hypothetical protein